MSASTGQAVPPRTYLDPRSLTPGERPAESVHPLTDLKPYLTEYFGGAYRQDDFRLERVEVENASLVGRWRASAFGARTDGGGAFHLTILNATVLVTQLAVAHGLMRLGRTGADTTSVQVEFRIRCRFPVKTPAPIDVKLDLVLAEPKATRKHPGVRGTRMRWAFSIAGEAFVGETELLFLERPGLTAEL